MRQVKQRDVTEFMKAESREALDRFECPSCGRREVRWVQRWELVLKNAVWYEQAKVTPLPSAAKWMWWNYLVCSHVFCEWERRGEE